MDTWYVNLKPVKWVQEVRHYPSINVEGRHLRSNCKIDPDEELILNNGANFRELPVELSILDQKPEPRNSKPLEQGLIGMFAFSDSMPAKDDIPAMGAFIHGWFYLKPDYYGAIWEQVCQGGYADCRISISVGPVRHELLDGPIWDVKRHLFIDSASVSFVRKAIPEQVTAERPAARRGFLRGL